MNTALPVTPTFCLWAKWLRPLFVALTLLLGSHFALAADQVPFKGVGAGAIVGAVPAPGGVTLTVVAEGQATQLGEFTRVEELLFNPGTGAVSGTIVFTAANGDQLAGVVSGGFVSPTTATGTYTFLGGTGRFKQATGSADFVVTTADGVHFTVEFRGTVSTVKGK